VLIDCDVHQNFASLEALLPYLPQAHRDHLTRGGYSGAGLPTYLWTHPEGFTRRDAVPPAGGPAGSDYETMRWQLLDAYDEQFTILNGEEILSASVMAHVPLATALTHAYNDWLLETWLPLDSRLKGSLGRLSGTTLPSQPYEYIYGRAGLVLRCPWHGWEFDLETGEQLVRDGLRATTYGVHIVDGLVTLYL